MTVAPVDLGHSAMEARRLHLLARLCAVLSAVTPSEKAAVAEIVVGWLDEVGAGSPRFDVFGDIREDARFWADIAHPAELEAYTAAGLRKIERTQFASGARKRLFVALWDAMAAEDKRKFLSKADPDGVFQKAKG